MKKHKDRLKGAVLILLLIFLTVGITSSFYTDHQSIVNQFKTREVRVSLNENRYNLKENMEKRSHISPREEIVKNLCR